MHLAVLTIHFYLHGCSSLKDKRARLRGLRDKFGSIRNIAVCECRLHDQWRHSEISFISVSTDRKVVESGLARIVDFCTTSVDAELTDHGVEWL